ncbi:siderophore-interacting protein [Glutamicibacter sp. BSL13]
MTASPRAFELVRHPVDLKIRSVKLAAREWLAEDYVRIRLEGEDLRDFSLPGQDDHLRIFPGQERVEAFDVMRSLPSREYTPLYWGSTDHGGWLDLEFAVHGQEGLAARWAAGASLGAPAVLGGPRGSLQVQGHPDGWLLAGDETAIPQIRRYAALIAEGAPATVLIEVPDAAHEVTIDTVAPVEYVHRGEAPAGSALETRLDAVTADERPEGDVFGFVAAEQSIVRPARALLANRWRIDSDRFVVKGYWKRGEAEYHAPHIAPPTEREAR